MGYIWVKCGGLLDIFQVRLSWYLNSKLLYNISKENNTQYLCRYHGKKKRRPRHTKQDISFSLITCTQHWCRKSQLTHTINVNICAALGRKSDWWSVLYNFDCFNTMGCGCIVITMWYPIIDTFDHLDSRLHITIVSVAFYDS